MGEYLNRASLIGRVGKAPQIKTLTSGKECAVFSLATSEVWKDKATGEKKEKTEWHSIVVYNVSLVQLVKKFVKKGSRLYVEGVLRTRSWAQPETELKYYKTEIILEYNCLLSLLDFKSNEVENSEEERAIQIERAHIREKNLKAFDDDGFKNFDDEVPF